MKDQDPLGGETAHSEKDEAFWKILSVAIKLDVKKGHLKWTLSELSRKSGITRSLIYYYFGRSKQDILKEAVKLIGEEFVGLGRHRFVLWEKGQLIESMLLTRAFIEKAPYVGQFLSEHRERSTELGEALRNVEEKFLNKLRTFFPLATEDQILTVFSIYWGMCFSPRMTEASIEIIVGIMTSSLNQLKKKS